MNHIAARQSFFAVAASIFSGQANCKQDSKIAVIKNQ